MSQPIVPSITDEQLAELENSVNNALNDPDSEGDQRNLILGIAAVIARLRAAEKDAARYRFIRSEYTRPGFLSSDPSKAKWLDEYLVSGEKMDAKIDLEMERSK